MKRTYPTNVNGQIFYIDEDAFMLLQNYLQQLKTTFSGNEGEEIVADIESRIREHFNEKINEGKAVIVLADVERVIETMGRPEDLSDTPAEGAPESSGEGKAQAQEGSRPFISFNMPTRKKLYRNMKNKVFGGVVGGLAVYLGWNANVMRLLLIILALCTKLFPLALVYLIAWMIIPPAVTPRQVLQMKGEPVNLDTVGQTIIADSPTTPPAVEDGNFFNTFFAIVGKCILGLIGLVAGVVSFACLIGFLCVLSGTLAMAFASSDVILQGLELSGMAWSLLGSIMAGFMLAVILFGAIAWGCASVLFSLPKTSKSWVVSLVITSVMLAAIAIALVVVGTI